MTPTAIQALKNYALTVRAELLPKIEAGYIWPGIQIQPISTGTALRENSGILEYAEGDLFSGIRQLRARLSQHLTDI